MPTDTRIAHITERELERAPFPAVLPCQTNPLPLPASYHQHPEHRLLSYSAAFRLSSQFPLISSYCSREMCLKLGVNKEEMATGWPAFVKDRRAAFCADSVMVPGGSKPRPSLPGSLPWLQHLFAKYSLYL